MSKGRVVTITGPVVDIEFERGQLPEILNAIKIERNDNGVLSTMTVEAAVHLGDNLVRCIAMSSTDGLVRGAAAEDTKAAITVPVGAATLGRVFNVWESQSMVSKALTVHLQAAFTKKLQLSRTCRQKQRFLKQELKLSTLWLLMLRVVKSVSSAARV